MLNIKRCLTSLRIFFAFVLPYLIFVIAVVLCLFYTPVPFVNESEYIHVYLCIWSCITLCIVNSVKKGFCELSGIKLVCLRALAIGGFSQVRLSVVSDFLKI